MGDNPNSSSSEIQQARPDDDRKPNIWRSLTKPSDLIQNVEHRRQAQLLASLLLVLIPLALAGAVSVTAADPSFTLFADPFFYIVGIAVLILTIAYGLSRTRYFVWGALAVVTLISVLTFASVTITDPGPTAVISLLSYLALVVLIASIFFSARGIVLVAVANIAGLLLLPLLSPDIAVDTVVRMLSYTFIVSALIIVAARHRDLVEFDRRAELAESEQRYRDLLETTFEGIIIHDDMTILEGNPGFAQMFGYEQSELPGMSLFAFSVTDSDKQIVRQLQTGTKQVHETQARKKDGTIIDVELVSKFQPYRGQVAQMTAVRDITERKRAEMAEQERRRVAETLRQATAVLTSTLELDEVLSLILRHLDDVIDFDTASVQLLEDDQLVLLASRGFPEPDRVVGLKFPLDPDFPNMRVVTERKALAFANVAEEYPHFQGEAKTYSSGHIRSWLGVPLLVRDRVIGMIALDRSDVRPFADEDVGLATAIANQAAIAIENAQLYHELGIYSEMLEKAVEDRTAELRQTKERVETILNHNPDPILLLKPNGIIDAVNPAFQTVFKYHVDELRGWSPTSLVTSEHADTMQDALRNAIEKHTVERLELVAQRGDDTTFDADVALAPIEENGDLLGVVCTMRDISMLKEVARMKDAFVSNVSHELRTPITSLKLNHKLIEMNPERTSTYVDRLGREIDRLNRLIEDLLRLSRLDQGRVNLDLRLVDLNRLAAQYVNDRTPLAESRELTLSFEALADLPMIQADEGLIGQSLSIILTNALNYTPAGGEVVVSAVSREVEGKNWAGFRVTDTGLGISPEEQAHLFERFFRGNAAYESGAPGTGLGLSIAREIVERHGGHIDVANRDNPQGGAVITVWLPIEPPKT
jgi:PAS domain S-box-containing protein